MIRKKLRFGIGFVLALFCLLAGCTSPRTLPDYRGSAFVAEIRLLTPTITLEASASVEKLSDPTLPRDVTLQLKSPEALSDVCLERRGGIVSLCYDGITLSGDSLSPLLQAIDLLVASGGIQPICETEELGEPLIFAELHSTKENTRYELYLSPDTGAPRVFRTDTFTLELLSFQPTVP